MLMREETTRTAREGPGDKEEGCRLWTSHANNTQSHTADEETADRNSLRRLPCGDYVQPSVSISGKAARIQPK